MAVLTSTWSTNILVTVITISVVIYLFFKRQYSYWNSKHVFSIKPQFFFGNFREVSTTKSFGEVIKDCYYQGKGHHCVGIWMFHRPTLIPIDLQFIKDILVKDFQYFHDRGIPLDEDLDPLTGHLFNMGGKKWRNLRIKLTPTFTSGKMKMMFPIIIENGKQLQLYLDEFAEGEEVVEMKELLCRFTTDIISSCAFGIESNCLRNPDSEFRKWGKQVFSQDLRFILINMFIFMVPKLTGIVKIHRMPKGLTNFFMGLVRETIEYREKNNIKRPDFMQLLIELKNKGKIEDADTHKSEAISGHEEDGQKFTIEQAAAQAFVFFLAGFETSSTTMMFCLYELAQNQSVQDQLRDEIDQVLSKHDGELNYEGIQDMVYMDMVVSETLRKYPPVPVYLRECTKEYKIPGQNITIEKGTPVMVPIFAVQSDPHYFPQPEKFDPERFTPEEKAKRDHFTSIPFGEGPRICIGERFGLMQTKVGLSMLLSKFKFEICGETQIPLKFDPIAFILTPEKGVSLKISRRS